MPFRLVMSLLPMLFGLCVFGMTGGGGPMALFGMLGGGSYARTVAKARETAMAAVADMIPHAPEDAPDAVFSHTSGPDSVTWTVNSGGEPVARMVAHFDQVDEARTKVHTDIETLPLPNGSVSPAFQNERLVGSMFNRMVDGALDRLVTPYDAATCASLDRQYRSPEGAVRQGSMSQMIGDASAIAMRQGLASSDLIRHGCLDGDHEEQTSSYAQSEPTHSAPVHITPGAPMADGRPTTSLPGE